MTDLAALAPAPGAPIPWSRLEAFLDDGLGGVAALAATPQDATFHAEGDVWTHTRMVVEALVALPAWRALDDVGRAVTFAAALLHDVGKPQTTRRDDDGRLTSRGHSGRGEAMARAALWRRGVPFGLREHVCALIRWHQVPFFGITREPADAERTAARLSLRLRHRWLAVVAEADARGRRCADPADQARMLEHTALWLELCRDLDCVDAPLRFADDHARVLYFEAERPGARRPDVAAHDDTTAEVVVMCGLPASGKDTWLAAHGVGPVVSLDDLRDQLDVEPTEGQGEVIAAAREAARVHLRAGAPFAWNATNLAASLRAKVIGLMRGYRARVHLVYCEAPAHAHPARNRDRARPVPARAIGRMLGRWSVPALDEAHRVTHVVDDDGPLRWPPAR